MRGLYTLMFICKCFCQEAVSSRTTTENPNTFPISLCDWNFVVVYIIPMANCLLNFPFFNDLFLVIKNLLLSEWWWIKLLSMGFSPPKPFPWIANEQSAFTSAQMEIRNERYSVWYLTKISYSAGIFKQSCFLRGRGICSKSLWTFLRES